MTTDPESQARLRDLGLKAMEQLNEIVVEPNLSATDRFRATELLLRVTPNLPPINAAKARAALARVSSLLEQIAQSHKSARMRLKAAKLMARIGSTL